jgi:hypothetical protein
VEVDVQITVEISETTEHSLRELAAMLDMSLEAYVQMRLRQDAERGYVELVQARERAEEFKRRWQELHKDRKIPVLSDEAMRRENLVRDVK